MSEEPKQTNEPPAAAAPTGVSRRDFLRRASREAVETGAKIVPGAAIARVVLGSDGPKAAEVGSEGGSPETAEGEAGGTPKPPAATGRGPIWQVMASWRQKRMEGEKP